MDHFAESQEQWDEPPYWDDPDYDAEGAEKYPEFFSSNQLPPLSIDPDLERLLAEEEELELLTRQTPSGTDHWHKEWRIGRLRLGFHAWRHFGHLPDRWVIQPNLVYDRKAQ